MSIQDVIRQSSSPVHSPSQKAVSSNSSPTGKNGEARLTEAETDLATEVKLLQDRIKQFEASLKETLANKQSVIDAKADIDKSMTQTADKLSEIIQENAELRKSLPITKLQQENSLSELNRAREELKTAETTLAEKAKKAQETNEANTKHKRYKKAVKNFAKLQEEQKRITEEVTAATARQEKLDGKIDKLEETLKRYQSTV